MKNELENNDIQIGNHYLVRRKHNEWLMAEVLQKRINKQGKFVEYYVHYETLNKRLDEWVPAKRIKVEQCELGDENYSWHDRSSNELLNESQLSLGTCQVNLGVKVPFYEDKIFENAFDGPDEVEKEHKQLTKVKYINAIQLGIYEIDTWYFSPYPDEYGMQEKLYICEYCLKYMKLEATYQNHFNKCDCNAPPGNVIYKKGTLVIHEIDPVINRLYCQNLCLLAKLFIDHKTVFYDVEQFLFYVLCEVDETGAHLRGYFSKEKESPDGYNVACILTLPPFQRQGYGQLLIAFSYELSKIEGVVGSPEKPLSDLGGCSYKSYWSWMLLDILKNTQQAITISTLSEITGFAEVDIIYTLQSLDMMKYWSDNSTICVQPEVVEAHILSGHYKRPRLTVDPLAITWKPYACSSRSSNDEVDV